MVFSSLTFLCVFLPTVFLLYYLTPSVRMQNILLIVASLVFYAYGEPVYILLMLFSILINYGFGLLLEKAEMMTVWRRATVITAVFVNLGVLFVFKYLDLTIKTLSQISHKEFPMTNLALPIGISFFSFQAMSYVIDVYRGRVPAEKNLFNIMLYIAFFPQLIAGPIVKFHDIQMQLHNRKRDAKEIAEGSRRFIVGLAKKVLISNTMAVSVDMLFSVETAKLNIFSAWTAALSYLFQIYFDFSGYSDMAVGLGRMLGFEFLPNFNYPYISKSITEFWRRWHISLSTWFREYLYIPLGGNRCAKPRWMFNLLVVWAATGIWHGANWTFLFWGLYFFALLMVEKFFLLKPLEKAPALVGHVYTMLFVMVSWAIFAIEDFSHLGAYLKVMFGLGGVPLANASFGYCLVSYLPILCLAALASTPLGASVYRRLGTRGQQAVCTVLIAGGLIACTAYLVDGTYNPFLYSNF